MKYIFALLLPTLFIFTLPGFAGEVRSSISNDALIFKSSADIGLQLAGAGVTHELAKLGCQDIQIEYASESWYLVASKYTFSFIASCPESIENVSINELSLYSSNDSSKYKYKYVSLLIQYSADTPLEKKQFDFSANYTEQYLYEAFNIPPQLTFRSEQKFGSWNTKCGAERIQLNIPLEKKAYFCENLSQAELRCLVSFGIGKENTINQIADHCIKAID